MATVGVKGLSEQTM